MTYRIKRIGCIVGPAVLPLALFLSGAGARDLAADLRQSDAHLRQGTFKWRVDVSVKGMDVDLREIERDAEARANEMKRQGAPGRIVDREKASLLARGLVLRNGSKQTRFEKVAFADGNSCHVTVTDVRPGGKTNVVESWWIGGTSYEVRSDALELGNAAPDWAQPDASVKYNGPGPCLAAGRGLSQLSHLVIHTAGAETTADGDAPGGLKVHAVIDPGNGCLTRRAEVRIQTGELMARWSYGPIVRLLDMPFPSWSRVDIFPDGRNPASTVYQLLTADFNTPSTASLAPPGIQGWRIVRDARLGKLISYRTLPSGVTNVGELLESTRKQVRISDAYDARMDLIARNETIAARIRLALIAGTLLTGCAGLGLYVRASRRRAAESISNVRRRQ